VVARGHTAVGEAGEARISLKLSAAVRRMLAKRGSLTLKLKLRYSASPVVEGAKLTLSSPHASAARRSSGGGRGELRMKRFSRMLLVLAAIVVASPVGVAHAQFGLTG